MQCIQSNVHRILLFKLKETRSNPKPSGFTKTEMSANPLANKGIELGAFDSMSTLYIRIAEAKLTAVPKGKTM